MKIELRPLGLSLGGRRIEGPAEALHLTLPASKPEGVCVTCSHLDFGDPALMVKGATFKHEYGPEGGRQRVIIILCKMCVVLGFRELHRDHAAVPPDLGDPIVRDLITRIKLLEAQVFVPGLFRCAKCECVLESKNLHKETGDTWPNNSPQECPNHCGPMFHVTWKERCGQLRESAERLHDELVGLRKQTKGVTT